MTVSALVDDAGFGKEDVTQAPEQAAEGKSGFFTNSMKDLRGEDMGAPPAKMGCECHGMDICPANQWS